MPEKKLGDFLEAVGFKSSAVEKAEVTPLRIFPELGLFSALVKPKDFLDLLKEALAHLVSFVEPVPKLKLLLKDTIPLVGADSIWSEGYTGKGVKVAVLDSGIWEDHPELKGRVIASKSFVKGQDANDSDGHGTHVAGIIAGNGNEYRGVAPDASLINAKVIGRQDKERFLDDLMAGMIWAVKECGADILNMSLGIEDPEQYSEVVLKLSSWMLDQMRQGVIFVAAAGNEGELGYETIDFPAIAPGVVAVAASDKELNITNYSSRGSERIEKFLGELKPTITAPGGACSKINKEDCVISTFPSYLHPQYGVYKVDDLHAAMMGTSMAAPHVSGGLALLVEALNERDVEKRHRYSLAVGALVYSAKKLNAVRYEQGWGFMDLPAALDSLGKYRYSVPASSSIDGLRKFFEVKKKETIEAYAAVAAETLQAFVGLSILGMAVSDVLGVKVDLSQKALGLLVDLYKSGQISREQFILAVKGLKG
jgi:subtilisin family serine protease